MRPIPSDDTPRPRVLVLVKGLGLGGTERLVVESARVRDRDQFEYEVAFVLDAKRALVSDLESEGVRTHCFEAHGSRELGWTRHLWTLLAEQSFQILHCHSPYPAGVARLVSRGLPTSRRPLLFSTEHNAFRTYSAPTRSLTRATSWLDDQRIAISHSVANSFPDRRRMQVIWQGVPLDDVGHNAGQRERVRSELGLDPGRLAIGTIANYVAQKDYPNLFEAVRRVSGSALARFFVIGQGPLARQVESLHATTGVADRVVLLGTRSDAVSVMAGWDIFVLASRFEGLPVALMEAMAMGLPIVATEVGGVPEAVRNGIEGLLVPPGRPDLLAAAIERLASDESLRQTMGAAARQRSAIFDIRTSTRALEQMYLSALRHV